MNKYFISMRNYFKFMIITIVTLSFGLQAVACTDNSTYNSFLSEVKNSEINETAFFGVLESKNDDSSKNLKVTIDLLNKKENGAKSLWEQWNDENRSMLNDNKLKQVNMFFYIGNNDKFSEWIKAHISNPKFREPRGVKEVKPIDTTKEDNKLTRVIIIVKGILYTAGEGWVNASSNPSLDTEKEIISEFIKANVFTKAF